MAREIFDASVASGLELGAIHVYARDGNYYLYQGGVPVPDKRWRMDSIPLNPSLGQHVFLGHPHPSGGNMPSLPDIVTSQSYGTPGVIQYKKIAKEYSKEDAKLIDHASKLAFSIALLVLTAAQVGCAVNPSGKFDFDAFEREDLTAFGCPDGGTVNVYQVLYENMDQIENSLRESEPTAPRPANWEKPLSVGFRQTERGPELKINYRKFLGLEHELMLHPPDIVVTIWPCSREIGDATLIIWAW